MTALASRLSRRSFLRLLTDGARVAAILGLAEAAAQGVDLLAQRHAWDDASRNNGTFVKQQAELLRGLRIGASFAPEQWPLDANGDRQARAGLEIGLRELSLRQIRLGLRWNRCLDQAGNIDLRAYAPYIEHCLLNAVEVCLNLGPVRVFRWPEVHAPADILRLGPDAGGVIETGSPLAMAGLAYLDALLRRLKQEYGAAAFPIVQVENEPFYPLGRQRWQMSPTYLVSASELVHEHLPQAALLSTSAGRLDLRELRDLFATLLSRRPEMAGKLISGFDFHYKTPLRDSYALVRHLDQISYAGPFAPRLAEHQADARALSFKIEVSEGQMEPNGHLQSPGNSVRDFRYLLLRCLREVLLPDTSKLIRIWGVEELVKKIMASRLSSEHRQIIELVQMINAGTPT